MTTHRNHVLVDAAPEAAFAYLADHRHAVTWDPTVVESQLVADGPIGLGASFDAVVTFYGRRLDLKYTLVEHDDPRGLAFAVSGGKVAGTIALTLEPSDAGTRVELAIDLALTGMLRFLGRGLDAALEGIAEKAADGIRRALAT